jgi:tRNA-specific 2-thiouridylase
VRLELGTNTLVVGGPEETLSSRFWVTSLSWTSGEPHRSFRAWVRVRHHHPPAPASLRLDGEGRAEIVFDEPQRAVATGQAAVFYSGEEVLGGGMIERLEPTSCSRP